MLDLLLFLQVDGELLLDLAAVIGGSELAAPGRLFADRVELERQQVG
jgi:hypothetical protein